MSFEVGVFFQCCESLRPCDIIQINDSIATVIGSSNDLTYVKINSNIVPIQNKDFSILFRYIGTQKNIVNIPNNVRILCDASLESFKGLGYLYNDVLVIDGFRY